MNKKFLAISLIVLAAIPVAILVQADELPVAEGCPGKYICIAYYSTGSKRRYPDGKDIQWCPSSSCSYCCNIWFPSEPDCDLAVGNCFCAYFGTADIEWCG